MKHSFNLPKLPFSNVLAHTLFLLAVVVSTFSAQAQQNGIKRLDAVIKDAEGVEFPGYVLQDLAFGTKDEVHFIMGKNRTGEVVTFTPSQLQSYTVYTKGGKSTTYRSIPKSAQATDNQQVFAESLYKGSTFELLFYFDPDTGGDYVVQKADAFYYLADRQAYPSLSSALRVVVADCPILFKKRPLAEVEQSRDGLLRFFRDYDRCGSLAELDEVTWSAGIHAGLNRGFMRAGATLNGLFLTTQHDFYSGFAPVGGLSFARSQPGKPQLLLSLSAHRYVWSSESGISFTGENSLESFTLGLDAQYLFRLGKPKTQGGQPFVGVGAGYRNLSLSKQDEVIFSLITRRPGTITRYPPHRLSGIGCVGYRYMAGPFTVNVQAQGRIVWIGPAVGPPVFDWGHDMGLTATLLYNLSN